jgi:23S rRNA (adenine2503-C2)-methyltransferase
MTAHRDEPSHPVARFPEEWKATLAARGERPFRAEQIFKWIHARGVLEPEQMTDVPESLREWVRSEGVAEVAETSAVHRSTDTTRKLLLRMADGATIETVIIPATKSNEEDADLAGADDEEDDELGVVASSSVRTNSSRGDVNDNNLTRGRGIGSRSASRPRWDARWAASFARAA